MEQGPVKNLRKLFVDEYQDVNPAQVKLIKAILPEDAKVVLVGNDLQCIGASTRPAISPLRLTHSRF